jgi:hypothetical protein
VLWAESPGEVGTFVDDGEPGASAKVGTSDGRADCGRAAEGEAGDEFAPSAATGPDSGIAAPATADPDAGAAPATADPDAGAAPVAVDPDAEVTAIVDADSCSEVAAPADADPDAEVTVPPDGEVTAAADPDPGAAAAAPVGADPGCGVAAPAGLGSDAEVGEPVGAGAGVCTSAGGGVAAVGAGAGGVLSEADTSCCHGKGRRLSPIDEETVTPPGDEAASGRDGSKSPELSGNVGVEDDESDVRLASMGSGCEPDTPHSSGPSCESCLVTRPSSPVASDLGETSDIRHTVARGSCGPCFHAPLPRPADHRSIQAGKQKGSE